PVTSTALKKALMRVNFRSRLLLIYFMACSFVGGDALIAPHVSCYGQVSRADEGIGPYIFPVIAVLAKDKSRIK
ncbi:MAG: hypothetical protein FWD25_08400, partial [Clostridia bacterium]|nr:hypothetical protein [Clostridia bacterium]